MRLDALVERLRPLHPHKIVLSQVTDRDPPSAPPPAGIFLGHSLAELLTCCRAHSAAFAALAGDVAKLDRFDVPTRYPNALPGGDPSDAIDEVDAESSIAQAERAIEHARGFLGARAVDPRLVERARLHAVPRHADRVPYESVGDEAARR